MNLLKETIAKLADFGLTPADVVWCGNSEGWFTWEDFEKVADVNYDAGYGGNEIAIDLIIAGKGWWLERAEYDGSEWWSLKKQLKKPSKKRVPTSVENIEYKDTITWADK